MPMSPWLMFQYWANAIKQRCVPISALQWSCKTQSTPEGQPEKQIITCCPLLLQGRLITWLGWPQQRCWCISQLNRDGWSHVTLLPDSSARASHREQDLGRRIRTFSRVCHAHPKPSSAHAAPSPQCPITDSPPPHSYLLFKTTSCIKFSFTVEAQCSLWSFNS